MLRPYTYVRALFGFVVSIIDTFVFCVLITIAALFGNQKLATRLITVWGDMILSLVGVSVVVSGEENLPASGGGILVFNHQSHLDIPAICAATDKQIRFGAKMELFKIPVFGRALRAIGTLPIARDNRKEVLRIYQDAAKRFEENTLFVLAPEGTRQAEPKIGRFKKGPFIFAANAHVPIFPVVIKGAQEVLPRKTLLANVGVWQRNIHVHFLPAISTEGFTPSEIEPLVTRTRDAMVNAFAELPQS